MYQQALQIYEQRLGIDYPYTTSEIILFTTGASKGFEGTALTAGEPARLVRTTC